MEQTQEEHDVHNNADSKVNDIDDDIQCGSKPADNNDLNYQNGVVSNGHEEVEEVQDHSKDKTLPLSGNREIEVDSGHEESGEDESSQGVCEEDGNEGVHENVDEEVLEISQDNEKTVANTSNDIDEIEDHTPRLQSINSLLVNVGSLQRDDSEADGACIENGNSISDDEKEGCQNTDGEVFGVDSDDIQHDVEKESPDVCSGGAPQDSVEEAEHEHNEKIDDAETDQIEENNVTLESLNQDSLNNEVNEEDREEGEIEEELNEPRPQETFSHVSELKVNEYEIYNDDMNNVEELETPELDEAQSENLQEAQEDAGCDEEEKTVNEEEETVDDEEPAQQEHPASEANEEPCSSDDVEEEHETQATMIDNSSESEESQTVKEIGKRFQNNDDFKVEPKQTQPAEMKSPVSVRRYKEIFEHGELLLTPGVYTAVPDSEVSSPRPGIVKSMRDLFEDPKNFEWPETTTKKTAEVN